MIDIFFFYTKRILRQPLVTALLFLFFFLGSAYVITFPDVPMRYIESLEKKIIQDYESEEKIYIKVAIYKIKNLSDKYRVSLWIRGKGDLYHEIKYYDYIWQLSSGIHNEIDNHINESPSSLKAQVD